jgi:hypothetical protein
MDLCKAPNKYYAMLVLGVFVSVLVVVLWNFDPVKNSAFFPQCSFKALTGLHCPGCGLTRAIHALVHGDIVRALSMNPFFVLASPLFTVLLMDYFNCLPKMLQGFANAIAKPVIWLSVLMTFWVLRNIPYYPFSLLAPN